MAWLGCGRYDSLFGITESLMPEAHPQARNLVIECHATDAEVGLKLGPSGPGRDDQCIEVIGIDRKPPRIVIILNDLDIERGTARDTLEKVVRERIVVVDVHDGHG